MRRLLALALPAALGLAACAAPPETPLAPAVAMDSTAALTAPTDGDDGLTITGIAVNHVTHGLTGRVENRAAVGFDSIHVWISLLDADRDSVEAVEMTRDSLGALSAWHFTRPFASDSVAYVRIDRYAGTRRGGERIDAVVRGVIPAPRMRR